jgi:hypothetical protein
VQLEGGLACFTNSKQLNHSVLLLLQVWESMHENRVWRPMVFICVFSLAPGTGDAFTSFLLGCPGDFPVGCDRDEPGSCEVRAGYLVKFLFCQSSCAQLKFNEL